MDNMDEETAAVSGSSVAKRFLQQEEAMRRLNERLELRRQELSRRTQAIVDHGSDRAAQIDVDHSLERDVDLVMASPFPMLEDEREGHSGGDGDASREPRDNAGESLDRDLGEPYADEHELQDHERSVQDSMQQLELEEQVLGSVGMAPESRERLFQARLNVAKNELERFAVKSAEDERELTTARKQIKELQDTLKTKERQVSSAENKCQKMEQVQQSSEQENQQLKRENDQLKKDMQTARKMVKHLEQQVKSKESKMNRSLADSQRFKDQLRNQESSSKASTASWRGEKSQLEAENKKLAKQKAELLNIVKKQMKLVDIVQRQKMHVEAARLLAFTEAEFTKLLDIGQDSTSRSSS